MFFEGGLGGRPAKGCPHRYTSSNGVKGSGILVFFFFI